MKPEHYTWDDPHGQNGPTVMCLCGWAYWHKRAKIRARAAKRHLSKVGAR